MKNYNGIPQKNFDGIPVDTLIQSLLFVIFKPFPGTYAIDQLPRFKVVTNPLSRTDKL